MRLKTAEIGYRLPESVTNSIGMDDMRIYLSGFNLVTWDSFKETDPESRNSSGQYYPQARVLNIGTTLTF